MEVGLMFAFGATSIFVDRRPIGWMEAEGIYDFHPNVVCGASFS
jgi:hypothetical protein